MFGGRPYLDGIQQLRAAAALGVVLYHLGDELARLGLPDPFRFGEAGVDLFFVVSGFVMGLAGASEDGRPGRFLARRAVRIVPLYWAATLSLFGLAMLAPGLVGTEAAPLDLLRSLLFVPFEKAPSRVEPLLFLGWTLNYEVAFYALVAVSLAAGRAGPALVLGVIAAAVAAGWLFAPPPSQTLAWFYTRPVVGAFGYGYALHLAWRRWPGLRVPGPVAALAATALVAWPVWPAQVDGLLTKAVPAAVLVAAATGRAYGGPGARAALAVGAASYALYLLHPYVLRAVGLAGRDLPTPLAAGVVLVLGVGGSVLLAVAVFRRGERPFVAWLRGRLGI